MEYLMVIGVIFIFLFLGTSKNEQYLSDDRKRKDEWFESEKKRLRDEINKLKQQ